MNYLLLLLTLLTSCNPTGQTESEPNVTNTNTIEVHDTVSIFQKQLSEKAISIIDPNIKYTPDYVSMPYPNGDVPANTGVCSDVVIRAYRKLNIDLQEKVHEDMTKNLALYPKKWGLKTTDKNIDHRRVPNLELFFERFGTKLPITDHPDDYKTGELVTWMIGNKLPHIGIITNQLSKDKKRRLIVHNIGRGQVMEDILFAYPITGHYVYEPK